MIKVYHTVRWHSGRPHLERLLPWSQLHQPPAILSLVSVGLMRHRHHANMPLFLCLVPKIYAILPPTAHPKPLKSNLKVWQLKCALSSPLTLKSCNDNAHKICCCKAGAARCLGCHTLRGPPQVAVCASCHPGKLGVSYLNNG